MKKFKFIVVGGGTAGLRTALSAASQGYNTALVNPGVLGGTCLNTGCIPTKAMLYASHLYTLSNELDQFGIKATKSKVDFPKLMKRVRWFINTGVSHINKSVKNHENLTLFKANGKFTGKNTLLAGKEEIYGEKIVIAMITESLV